MVANSKERLDPVEFGRRLLTTGDLDPLYIALWEAKIPRSQLCCWLLSYFCFYNAGLSCWITSQEDYWEAMRRVPASGTEFPRGAERRHFRGNFAIKAIHRLSETYPDPTALIAWLGEAGPSAKPIMSRVKSLYGFGEWISWKVPDICERLGVMNAQFVDEDCRLMFSSSLKGAAEISAKYGLKGDPVWAGHRYLMRKLGTLKAPPSYDRYINVQETETICCKWHSHMGGHYPVGKDTEDIKHSLLRYQESSIAQQMLIPITRLESDLCRQ